MAVRRCRRRVVRSGTRLERMGYVGGDGSGGKVENCKMYMRRQERKRLLGLEEVTRAFVGVERKHVLCSRGTVA